MQVGLAQIVESKSQLAECESVVCMSQIHHAWKNFRPNRVRINGWSCITKVSR